jgi:hypothetical protein
VHNSPGLVLHPLSLQYSLQVGPYLRRQLTDVLIVLPKYNFELVILAHIVKGVLKFDEQVYQFVVVRLVLHVLFDWDHLLLA